jgi:hypothetical protein
VQVYQSSSNGSGHADSHRRANRSSESVSGLSIYAIVMIIVKRHPPFFSNSQSNVSLCQISTAPSLRIVATLPNIPLGETNAFVEKSTYNRGPLVFATIFYLLVRNRKTRRGICAFFWQKISSSKIIACPIEIRFAFVKYSSQMAPTRHSDGGVPHDIRQRSGISS